MTDHTNTTPPPGGWQPQSWQPGDPAYQVPTHPHQPPQSTNGLAIASMVLGILWFWPLALFFGYRGRRQIDESQGAEGGRGMAVAGIVLGWVGLAGAVIVTALIVATAASVDSELDRLEDDLGAVAPAEPAGTVPATDDDLDDLFAATDELPAPGDFTLDVVVTSKQCFGTAGCLVDYEIEATWFPIPDTDYSVTYQVDGDESGPIIDTMTVTGDTYEFFPGFASTTGENVELTATATEVRP